MTGHILLAACCPGRGIRLVADPMQSSRVGLLRPLVPQWFPWYQGFLREEQRMRPWCWPKVCNAVQRSWGHPQSLVQCSMVFLMHLKGDGKVEASLLGPTDNNPRMFQTLPERLYSWGELEPQEAQKATTCPCEHPEAPKPEEPAKWSDTTCPSAPQPQHHFPVVTKLATPEEPGAGLVPCV